MNPTLEIAGPPREMAGAARANTQKILVVDDEPLVRNYIAASLRAGGYDNLIFGSNGSCVPSISLSEHPELIIMDVMMPRGNGLRALRLLRESPITGGIPVIMTSGFGIQTLGECARNWADRFLSKPFTAVQLLAEVGTLLARL